MTPGENNPAPSPQHRVDPAPHVALGLPARVGACLFDLEGVCTDTARLHAAAWKEMFDGVLTARVERTGAALVAFDELGDYDAYIDSKSRSDDLDHFCSPAAWLCRLVLRSAVSSPPTCSVLTAAGIAALFQIRIDGLNAEEQHLPESRRPDTTWQR
jgi:hypothetical protein